MNIVLNCEKCNNELEEKSRRKIREDVDMIWIVKMSCEKCNTTIFARAEIQLL